MTNMTTHDTAYDTALALIGMSGRFPGAQTIAAFWQNVAEGRKSIRFFSAEELLAIGVDAVDLRQPHYVKAGAVLEKIDHFDAAFFGYTPREAEIMDPQHRLFLECVWEALEDAAYAPEAYTGLIGVFAGSAISTYLLNNIYSDAETLRSVGKLQASIGNDKDSLATAASYKFNLKGPSVAVQSFCSTSLVAVHLACQSLLNFECDMALAGGVAISIPQETGYFYEEGGIVSPDGECRTFDAHGQGSVMGNGVGVVALKRFREALEDGDHIYAVIRGSAMNNDGSMRVSYTAPGLDGQTEVISEAIGNAGIDAESISYIEAHGTATELGDAVELAAMINAFGSRTQKKGFCALGSVKPNVGHLDRAAGVTGLIKTALAMQHKYIPPSLNFEHTHSDIDLANSPFYVNTTLQPWQTNNGTPRRAGVSSFGLGGTNVHMLLEEAPGDTVIHPSRPWHLLLLSARTSAALDCATTNLISHWKKYPELDIADISYTLHTGRTLFNHRRLLLCQDRNDALTALEPGSAAGRVSTVNDPFRDRKIAFLLPGSGEQYVSLAQELYRAEATFREIVERCCAFLPSSMQIDIRSIFSAEPGQNSVAELLQPSEMDSHALIKPDGLIASPSNPFAQTVVAQPAIFVLEYALARLLQQWGIRPQAMLGYSLGEYVAACLAGVFSLEDALRLVARRAQLIYNTPRGAMLTVNLGEKELQPYLTTQLSLAVLNSPMTCVVSGPEEAIALLERQLVDEETSCQRVSATHAFHSPLMEPLRHSITDLVRSIKLSPPQIPYISNVTGTWISHEQATDPAYWATHLCQTVRFADGIHEILQDPEWLLLEVGPGQALSSFVKQHPSCASARMPLVLSTLPAPSECQSCHAFLLTTLGKLWQAGVTIDWRGYYAYEQRRRVSLPPYPFERQRYWIEPRKKPAQVTLSTATMGIDGELERLPDITNWFYLPSWRQTLPCAPYVNSNFEIRHHCWLIFVDDCGIGTQISADLRRYHQPVITVKPGTSFAHEHEHAYIIRPGSREDYEALLNNLHTQGTVPTDIVHLWTLTSPGTPEATARPTYPHETALDHGFFSLLALVQCLGNTDQGQQIITIISNETQDVVDGEPLCPAKAAVIGPCRVIPQEYANIHCRCIDITIPEHGSRQAQDLLTHLVGDLTSDKNEAIVALRGGRRWVQTFEPVRLQGYEAETIRRRGPRLRQDGTYLITGGLGGIGLAMAEELVRTFHANVILTSRTGLPPREQWAHILLTRGASRGVGRQIRQVQDMEERGAHVMVCAADVTNEAQMRLVIQQALTTFGTLHGILHTAGVPGIGLMQMKTAEQVAQVLAPKVTGTLVLARLLQERPDIQLDFLALFSSMSSITGGGPGQVDYCAANAFLDAYARAHHAEHGITLSIDWGEWQWNAWEAGLGGYDAAAQTFFRAHRQGFGVSFAEGIEAFKRILSYDLPQVVVSTQEFCAFVEISKTFTAASILERTRERHQNQTKHARPALGTSYIAPHNDVERQLIAIWEELLGIAPLGIEDNFFELGGNSLTGVDLMARIKKALNDDRMAAHVLYEAPSVSTLARYIAQSQSSEQAAEWDERSEKRRDGLRQRIRETGHMR